MASQSRTVEALELTLHGIRVGVLLHLQDNRNLLVFDPDYARAGDGKPTLTVGQLADANYLFEKQASSLQLPTLLSNLLPEGALREWMAKGLKININNEFAMMAYSGSGLTGALMATPIAPENLPAWADTFGVPVVNIKTPVPDADGKAAGFSLAGVQIKFSGTRKDGRFNLRPTNDDNWIIKTPSTLYPHVPNNEFTSMRLAEAIGVEIPEIELIEVSKLDNLPSIKMPDEEFAFAIRRFDRQNISGNELRIHTEDFAQVFGTYSHNKYEGQNSETIGAALYRYSAKPLSDIQQMARRLIANILIGNGDAHLKNWSLIYPDKINPVLSPAYDIVATHMYIEHERTLAFKMGKQNDWYQINMGHFEVWATRIGVSWPAIRVHVIDAVERARADWPRLLEQLPMHYEHKTKLHAHWANLTPDFRIS